MAEDAFVVRRGRFLAPVDGDSEEYISRLPEGEVLRARLTRSRNYKYLQRAFALIKLGWMYWEPETMVSQAEERAIRRYGRYLLSMGISAEAEAELTRQVLDDINRDRQTAEVDKSHRAFRHWATIQAGFYDIEITPAGPRKVAKSWAFAKTGEEEFRDMCNAILGVVWNVVLAKHFDSPEEAENAAAQVQDFH